MVLHLKAYFNWISYLFLNFKYDVILKSYHEKSFLINNKERINEVSKLFLNYFLIILWQDLHA
jgi:hypothetical protein